MTPPDRRRGRTTRRTTLYLWLTVTLADKFRRLPDGVGNQLIAVFLHDEALDDEA